MKEFLLPIITSILISLGIISPISQQANLGAPSFNYIVGTSTMETRFADGSSTTTIKAATSTFAGNVSIIGRTTLFGSLNASSTATTTLSNGIQLYGGCFRDVSGSCIISGLSAAITSLGGLTGAAQTFSSNDLLTVTSAGTNHHFNASTSPFFGTLTASGTINFTGLSNGAVSVSSGVLSSGTLIVGSGGTGRTNFTSSQLLYGNGAENLSSVATSSASCSGSVSCSAFTVVGSVSPTITSSAALFAWTPRTDGNATTTRILLDSGFISSASSTISNSLLVSGTLNASSSLAVTGNGYFNDKIGIGITSPNQKLEINDGSIALSRIGTAGSRAIGIGDGSGSLVGANWWGGIEFEEITSGTKSNVHIVTTEGVNVANRKLSIFSDGKIGIGTTSPGALLAVQGTGLFTNTLTAPNIIATGTLNVTGVTTLTNASTTGMLTIGKGFISQASSTVIGNFIVTGGLNASSTLTVAGNSIFYGNVGIGTVAPTAKVHVVGGTDFQNIRLANVLTDATTKNAGIVSDVYTTANRPLAMLLSYNSVDQNWLYLGGGQGGVNAATQIKFWTAANNNTNIGTERMTIDKDGNVGIGTTGPQEKLHIESTSAATALRIVADDVNFNPRIDFIDDRGTGYRNARISVFRDMSVGGDAIIFSNAATNAEEAAGTLNERVRIDRLGNVGIGTTSPQAKLAVTNIDANASLLVSDSTDPDATPFIVDKDGNVGVGTTSPTTGALNVNGDIYASGNIDIGLEIIFLNTDSATPSVGRVACSSGKRIISGGCSPPAGQRLYATFASTETDSSASAVGTISTGAASYSWSCSAENGITRMQAICGRIE